VERETGAAVLGVVPKMKPLEPGKTRIALSPHLDPTSPSRRRTARCEPRCSSRRRRARRAAWS
jgi:hypothetical protein